jgi:hypothetical protein
MPVPQVSIRSYSYIWIASCPVYRQQWQVSAAVAATAATNALVRSAAAAAKRSQLREVGASVAYDLNNARTVQTRGLH